MLVPFGANSSFRNPTGPICPQAPDDPAGEKDQRHRQRQVDVSVGASKERFLEPEALGSLMPPADRADAGEEPDPVRRENEDEDRRKEPERLPNQLRSEEAFEKAVQALNQPFQKILRPVGHLLHVPCRHLCEDDEAERHNPGDDHRIGDRETERPGDLQRFLREAVTLGGGDRVAGRQRDSQHGQASYGQRGTSLQHRRLACSIVLVTWSTPHATAGDPNGSNRTLLPGGDRHDARSALRVFGGPPLEQSGVRSEFLQQNDARSIATSIRAG